MRASTFISFAVALVLAILAVFGARTWLVTQRAQITAESQQPVKRAINTLVVAKSPMRFGERLTADRLELIDWASDKLPAGSFTSINDLAGTTDETARFVLAAIEKGEPVLQGKITAPGLRAKLSTAIAPGLKAVSIRVNDVLGVAGFVLPGDRVDVMLTRMPNNDAEGAFVDILLQGVKVLAIDQSADDRKDQPSVVRTVTFEVTTEEAQKLTLGATIGTLSLTLRNIGSAASETNERVTLFDLMETSKKAPEPPASVEPTVVVPDEAQLALERKAQEQLERLTALEATVRSIGTDVSGRLDSVEGNLLSKEPVIVEKEVIVERVVEVPIVPPLPEYVTVGVVRNGQRIEYRVTTD